MSTKANIIVSIVLLLIVVLNVNTAKAETTDTSENIYKQLTAIKCDSLIKANVANPNFVILDVRTPGEYSSYHLMGAINRSTGDTNFDAQLAALPKQKRFLLHCQSGGRSAGAFTKMKNLGYAEVYEMIGGLNSWNTAKLPTTTITGPKLMLVSKSNIISGNNTDTIKITLTNRANEKLTFSSVSVSDLHPFHSPKYSGIDSTKVKLESNGGNLEISIVLKDGVISEIEEQQITELSVYPNPATSKFFIEGFGIQEFKEISIISLTGKLVLSENDVYGKDGMDISQLQNGIYIVRIKTEKQIVSKKLVIKK